MKYFQEGGAMPQEAAPAPEAGAQDQMMQLLVQMAQEILSSLGPDAAAMLAQIIMEMLQGGQEMPAPEQQPAFQRNGGKLTRIR